MSAKHTALPWRVGELNGSGIEIVHDDQTPGANSFVLARVTARQTWRAEAEVNAKFIVRAVNAHEDLVDALYRALPFIEEAETDPHYKTGSANKVVAQIRAALAKATGDAS